MTLRHFAITTDEPADGEMLLTTAVDALSEHHNAARGPRGSIVISDPTRPHLYAWIAESEPPGSAGSYSLDIVGAQDVAAPLAIAYAKKIRSPLTDLTLRKPGDAWDSRTPSGAFTATAAVEAAPTVLDVGPWIMAAREALSELDRPIVVRTPEATRVSPVMRRFLRTGWMIWVRETAAGPVEGLSGTPIQWEADGSFTLPEPPVEAGAGESSAPRAEHTANSGETPHSVKTQHSVAVPDMLRVSVLHAVEDAHDIGLLTERVLEYLGGSIEQQSAHYGWGERGLSPWDRRELQELGKAASPNTSAWCLLSRSLHGTVAFRPTPSGIVEEIDADLAAPVDTRALWDAIRDLVPLTYTVTGAEHIAAHLTHASIDADIADIGHTQEAQSSAPAGYRGFFPER